jgi:hypothetical protein
VSFCTNCGAPIQKLVAGRCPFCQTILDKQQAGGLFIDARGPIWRVVMLAVGGKPKKVAKALVEDLGWSADQANAFVASKMPCIVVDNINGMPATKLFIRLHGEGAEATVERRQGADFIVANSSQIVRDFMKRKR